MQIALGLRGHAAGGAQASVGALHLVVGDGGLDGVLGEDGAVDLDRRQRQFLGDVGVLDLQRLVERLALRQQILNFPIVSCRVLRLYAVRTPLLIWQRYYRFTSPSLSHSICAYCVYCDYYDS